MENMDKTVPKWVLIVWPKIPQMLQNLSAQFVCPSPKVWDFNKKGFIGRPQSVPQVIGMSNQTQSKATAQCAIYSHFNDAVCYKLTSYRPQGRTFEFFLQIIISQPAQFSSLDLSNSAWCNSALWNQQVSILFSLVLKRFAL